MRQFFLFLFTLLFAFGQDKISAHEEARKHEENLLRQMTQKESKVSFINIRNHKKAVVGTLTIEGMEFPVKDGAAIVPEEKIKMMNSPILAGFSGKGYISSKILLHHAFGAVDNIVFYVLDNTQPNRVQIVLNWDNRSGKYDLDSHLMGNDLHVFYRNKSERSKWGSRVTLDRDVVRGNAYEMITIDKPSIAEDYRYFVRKYRGRNDWASKNVTVTVYTDNVYREQFTLENPFGKSFKNWLVFKLNSEGQIVRLDLKK